MYRPFWWNVSLKYQILADHVSRSIESVCAVDQNDTSSAALLLQEGIHNVTKLLHLATGWERTVSFNEDLCILYATIIKD